MCIDCCLHKKLIPIQKGVHIPYQWLLVNKLKKQGVDDIFACWVSHLLPAGLTIFMKRCCSISQTSFSSCSATSYSFIILASQGENHTHYLPPNFCDWTPLGLRLISACVRPLLMLRIWTTCQLTCHCLSQVGTSREFLSVWSSLPTSSGSVRISWQSPCILSLLMIARGLSNQLDLSTPAWEIGWCRVFPFHLDTSAWTLCSTCDIIDNLSCDGRFEYTLELKHMVAIYRSSKLLNPTLSKNSMTFCIASFPIHNRFQTCVSRPHAVGSMSVCDPLIFSIRILHF